MYDAILDNYEDEATRTRVSGNEPFAEPGIEAEEDRATPAIAEGQIADSETVLHDRLLFQRFDLSHTR